MNIGTYYTKLKGLWDEWDALCSIPTWAFWAIKEVLKFLMGLDDAYDVVRGQILLINPLLAVTKAYLLIIQDEK